jgi:uncharacterized Fe-S cluster protein YjdI
MPESQPDTKDYPREELVIHWTPSLCQHSGVCARGLPGVFKPRERPWIDPHGATAQEIADRIDLCPSRALGYTWVTHP